MGDSPPAPADQGMLGRECLDPGKRQLEVSRGGAIGRLRCARNYFYERTPTDETPRAQVDLVLMVLMLVRVSDEVRLARQAAPVYGVV